MQNPNIHETTELDPGYIPIGYNTKIWQYCHIRKGVSIGKNCNIGRGVYIDRDVKIGNNCKIQNYVCIYKGVTIGNNVFIGPHVCFTNDKYPKVSEWSDARISKTLICDDVSIGANAAILPGITIGKGAMIGAGAVVTDDVSPGSLVYGNPAKEFGGKYE